jgi:hypothetical protein
LESALADIQLMGSPAQVAMIPNFLANLELDPTIDSGDLLRCLRSDLRRELNLPELSDDGLIVRINPAAYLGPPK